MMHCRFKNLHNERDQEVHENYINRFSKKILLQCNLVILDPKVMHPHNSGSTLANLFLEVAQCKRPGGTPKLS